MKRMAIISCNIIDGKFFSYQRFILQEIKKVTRKVVLVSHQPLGACEEEYCMREGIQIQYSEYQYDVSMWRDVILQCREEIETYDSLIILNDSFFGPLYSFEEVFCDMERRKLDFWGITVHGRIPRAEQNVDGVNEWPRFLQRYFLVFNRTVVTDECFWEFWGCLPEFVDFSETETKFEYILTDVFEKKGFIWEAYCNTEKWEPIESKSFLSFLLFQPYKLLHEKKLPVISKEMLFIPKEIELCYHCGNEICRVFEYIKNNTTYNLDYIYDYLISELNVYDIWEKTNSTYVLPIVDNSYEIEVVSEKVVVIAHLYYEDLFQKSISYLRNVPCGIDIVITTDSEEKKQVLATICKDNILNKWTILKVKQQGREWSALLVEAKEMLEDYEFFCFIHDKKSSQMYYSSVGENFNDFLWNNMLGSSVYINNILQQFKENNRLGLLVPPVVYHGEFWGHAVDFWTICYESTKALAERLKLNYLPDATKPLLTVGSVFWARKAALQGLLKYSFRYDDFPREPMAIDGTINHSLERIIAFVAQDAGYYTGIVMSKYYAENDLVNKNVLLQKILKELRNNGNVDLTSTFSTLEDLRKSGREETKSKKNKLLDRLLAKTKSINK